MREKVRDRITVFYAFVIFLLIILSWRVYEISIIHGEELADTAERQQMIMLKFDEEEDMEYLYITSIKRVEESGEKVRFMNLMRSAGVYRLKDNKDYFIYGGNDYDEQIGNYLKKIFGTLIIRNAEKSDRYRIFAYADRDGNLMPGINLRRLP